MTQITHPELVRKLFKDPTTIHMTPDQVNLLHAAVGLAGEAGEVLELVTGHDSYNQTATQAQEYRHNMVLELGDLAFYAEAFRQAFDHKVYYSDPEDMVRGPQFHLHVAAKIAVHSSQILDTVKKMVFNNRTHLRHTVIQHLCQLEDYLGVLRAIHGITRQETLDANIAKLSARYEDLEYSDEAAAVRRDEA